jgi:hypothetical protein
LKSWIRPCVFRIQFNIASILRFPNELHVLITYKVSTFQRLWPYFYTNKYRQIKFRMKVYNKIGTYKNKSTTINKI